tara:strand:- start:80829 stop:81128 length:300 start_codon:yes stop_codon:yes gene_type:complete
MDFTVVKTALETAGLSVYKMDFPITLVGDTEETTIPLAAKCFRVNSIEKIVEFFEHHKENGIKTVYLYKVLAPDDNDKLYRVRAAWHLDANGPNDTYVL